MMIYKTDGFIRWQRKLSDRRAQERIATAITRLGFGLGDVKSVGGQVSELRIDYGPGYRVYFTRRGDEIIILLCGGDKSTQDWDIRKAKEIAAVL
ncbi:MAG: type II toxin-antitoxin system RelE/ParE family toxin [Alphaproteobacteria bacterium]|nr:type II toxin-antitoxin system RelE/ParE family toxin [Alphaproteobacteria bacterium]